MKGNRYFYNPMVRKERGIMADYTTMTVQYKVDIFRNGFSGPKKCMTVTADTVHKCMTTVRQLVESLNRKRYD